jgi:hypothetical protein
MKAWKWNRVIGCTLSLTSTLDGGGWSTPHPDRVTSGKETLYTLHRRLSGPQGRCGRLLKILPPLGFDLLTVQPVGSRCTNCAFPAHLFVSVDIQKSGFCYEADYCSDGCIINSVSHTETLSKNQNSKRKVYTA